MRNVKPGGPSRSRVNRAPALPPFLLLAALLLPAVAAPQEGTITYDRSIRYDFELPEGLAERAGVAIPSATVTHMALAFNGSEALLKPMATEDAGPQPQASDRVAVARVDIMLTRLRSASTSRSDQETLLQMYVSYEDGTLTETRELLGRKFLITGKLPTWAWKLSGEEGEFLGYRVQKAVAERDSTTVEAWFTPEIPVSAGPGPYGGLPGMILVVSVDEGHTQFKATSVSLDPVDEGTIRAPTEGDQVSREEYETIVADKLKELEATRRRRGGGAGK